MVELIFPDCLVGGREEVRALLRRLGTERQDLHWRKLMWCFVGLPVTAPIGLIPL